AAAGTSTPATTTLRRAAVGVARGRTLARRGDAVALDEDLAGADVDQVREGAAPARVGHQRHVGDHPRTAAAAVREADPGSDRERGSGEIPAHRTPARKHSLQ